MSEYGVITFKNRRLPVDELTVDAIESLGLKAHSGDDHYVTLGRFCFEDHPSARSIEEDNAPASTDRPSKRDVQQQIRHQKQQDNSAHPDWEPAANAYVFELKQLAKKCHADQIKLLGFGGEALVFELYRSGRPLEALIRMEPGNRTPYFKSVAEDEEAEISEPLHLEPFSPSFTPHVAARPCYYESIETVRTDMRQVGMLFQVVPKIYNFQRIIDEGYLHPDDVHMVITHLKDLAVAGGLDTSELNPKNIGVYINKDHQLHVLYQDPGNMLHFHNLGQIGRSQLEERIPSLIRVTTDSITDQHAQDKKLRAEIAEDATKLFAGKRTHYAKNIESIKKSDRPDDIIDGAWAQYLERISTTSLRPHL